jgi:phage-related protein
MEGIGFIKQDIGSLIDAVIKWDAEFTDGLNLIKQDFINVFTAIGEFFTGIIDGIASGFQAAFEAIAGFIDTYIIGPINAALGLVSKAKEFITGDSSAASLGSMSQDEAAAKTQELHDQNMRKFQNVGSTSGAGLTSPAASTTVNDDHSTTVGAVNVTVNQASPEATGEAYGQAVQKVAGKSERSQR